MTAADDAGAAPVEPPGAADDTAGDAAVPTSASTLRGGAPVVVEYVHDEAMAVAGMAVHVAFGERAWRRWLLRGAGIYLIFAGVLCLTLFEANGWMPVFAALFLAGAIFAFTGRKPLALWVTRRHHRKRPDSDRRLVITVHDAGVDMHVEGLADATFGWPNVMQAVLAEQALMLYISFDEYIHVPRALLGDDDLARVVAQVHERVPRVVVTDTSLEAAA